MTSLKWWMRIVGALYLMEGGGLSLMALFATDEFAAMWASAPVASLDEVAVRGTLIAGLPGVLTWVLLGIMLLIFSRVPARARVLVVTVVAWELLVWVPSDLIGFFNGFAVGRVVGLITVHAVIGVSGMLVLRQAPKE